MSHIPERKEKDCLNCGTIVQGHYCQNCGQENVVPKETFWHMVTHFFYDITHFDSNFFHTIHHLILKPGFLSREYMSGRRASYLHPIKMYVFTSAIFFLLFFSIFKPKDAVGDDPSTPISTIERAQYLTTMQKRLVNDTANKSIQEKIIWLKDTSRIFTLKDVIDNELNESFRISFADKEYNTFGEYDSAQKQLPSSDRDGWFLRRIIKLGISINNKYKENPGEASLKIAEGFMHRLPYMLFVSLPLFALILRLVYIRRKQFFFADHGVFTIHLYIFSFIVLLAIFGLGKLEEVTGLEFIEIFTTLLFIGMIGYLYIAMRKFYRQGWGKTFLKFLIVSLLSLVMMIILFLVFLLFSAASI